MEKISETKVLDHGVVALLEIMGSDKTIADSARISYNKESTKQTSTDEQLIRYLVRHRHTSPLEMGIVRFYLKLPIFVARQLVRHRTASLNEVSGRYSELPDDMYVPGIQELGPQSAINKQGRDAMTLAEDDKAHINQSVIDCSNNTSYQDYSLLLRSDVSREISRIVLPLATYTEMIWSCDVHNFLHFLKLRLDPHAQYEMRVFAQAMYDAVEPHFPIVFKAFNDYIHHAHTLSIGEQKLLSDLLRNSEVVEPLPTQVAAEKYGMSTREHAEFTTWLTSLLGKV